MALPELYRYGREGHWFSMKWFVLYMLDGIFQVCLVFCLVWGNHLIGYSLLSSTFSSITPTLLLIPLGLTAMDSTSSNFRQ